MAPLNAAAASSCGLDFSGYRWRVRDASSAGPGPNRWSARNAWLDGDGRLHLAITRRAEGWTVAEVRTEQSFGFGTFDFEVASPLHDLDPNIVLGLFTYPSHGTDGTHEIDIEFARWGKPRSKNWNVRVWPAEPLECSRPESRHAACWRRPEPLSDHRFEWLPTQVSFESSVAGERVLAWTYAPPDSPGRHVSQQPWPVHINLWLYRGRAPANGQESEIVIRSFRHTPAR